MILFLLIIIILNVISKNFKVKFFSRLFQICSPDLSPILVKLVEALPESKRGTGGFGSTGTTGLKSQLY